MFGTVESLTAKPLAQAALNLQLTQLSRTPLPMVPPTDLAN